MSDVFKSGKILDPSLRAIDVIELLFGPQSILPTQADSIVEVGWDGETEWNSSEVEVELEERKIQRLAGYYKDDGEFPVWVDTSFDPSFEDIDDIRQSYPSETYREVVVVNEDVYRNLDVVDDPYGRDYNDLLQENTDLIVENDSVKAENAELRQISSELHNTIEHQDDVKAVAADLLLTALNGRNEVGDRLAEIHGLIEELEENFEELSFADLKEIIEELGDTVSELPLVYNTNAKQLADVAEILGVEGRFTFENVSPENLPDGAL